MSKPLTAPESAPFGIQIYSWVGALLLVLGTGVMVLGYHFNLFAFREVLPGGVIMRFNTALCFAALGSSLLLHNRFRVLSKILAVLVVGIAAINMLETLLHIDLGIDQLFAKDNDPDRYSVLPPGRLGLTVSLCFILLSLPIIIPERPWLRPWLQAMPLVVLLNCMINLLGYLFYLYPNREMVRISQMAIHTAIGLTVGSFGLISMKPYRNLKSLLIRRDAQGQLFRKAVGYIIVVPSIIASFILLLLRNELVNNGYGLTLFVMVFGLSGVIALWSYVDRTNELYQLASRNENLLKAQNEEISRINAALLATNAELKDSYNKMQEQASTIENLLQDSLRLSEQNYRQLFEAQPLPLLVYEVGSRKIINANQALVYQYGYSLEDLMQLRVDDLVLTEDVDKVKQVFQDHDPESGKVIRLSDIRHQDANGRVFWVETMSHGLEYERTTARLLVINDVTEKRLSDERFGQLSQSIQTYLFEVDSQLRYTYINQYSLQQIGKSAEEMLGKRITEVYPDYEDSEFLNKIKRCLHTGQVELMSMKTPSDEGDLYFDIAFYPSSLGVTILSRDITDQKRVETSLQENEQFISSLLTAMPSYIYLYDSQKDELVFANEGLNASMGYTSEDLLGATMADLLDMVHPADRSEMAIEIINDRPYPIYKAGQVKLIEYRLRAKDGQFVWVQDRSIVYKSTEEGEPMQILGVIGSIHEIKSYQIALMEAKARAEDASQAKTQFLANMSHELRNPLNALMGITQLFERDYQSDDKINQYVALMRQSANRLLNTIGDVLDLSKIEANKISVHPRPLDLVQALGKSIEVFRPLAEKKGLAIKLETSQSVRSNVLLDSHLLDQIVNNLLTNAIKFTNHGQIVVRLLHQKIGTKEFQGFEVVDTGIGMSESFIAEKLFTTFEQESAGFSKVYEGSGLGLHIAKRFVGLMGGTIEVKSQKNEGTTFQILFPL